MVFHVKLRLLLQNQIETTGLNKVLTHMLDFFYMIVVTPVTCVDNILMSFVFK